MGLFKKLSIKDFLDNIKTVAISDTEAAAIYYKKAAFISCTRMLANFMNMCEFRTYKNGKEVFGQEYYLWNVSPNRNQNAFEFLNQWVTQLLDQNEALIFERPGSHELLIADSFTRTEKALIDDEFDGITVKGYSLSDTLYSRDVLYTRLNQESIRAYLDSMINEHVKMLQTKNKSYKRERGQKATLAVEGNLPGDETQKKAQAEMLNQRLKTFFDNDNAVLPLDNGYKLDPIFTQTRVLENSRDYRSLIDDIYDFTATAIGIPPALLKGSVAGLGDALDSMVTTIQGYATLLETEINRKRYTAEDFSRGSKLTIDTSRVKPMGMMQLAANGDKLISNGFYSVNEIRRKMNEPLIDEPWANDHFITLNYQAAAVAADQTGEKEQQNEETDKAI
jgi:HK97 family phage portal protein